MNAKKVLIKALAPAAMKTAEKSTGWICGFFANQPKLPKKLMNTVK